MSIAKSPAQVPDANTWRRCNMCKKNISYKSVYWVCNVSTCNRKRTGLVFCDVSCWDAHLPMMNHRESWAVEKRAPSKEEWAQIQAEEAQPKKRNSSKSESEEESEPEEKKTLAPSTSSAPAILRRKVSGENS